MPSFYVPSPDNIHALLFIWVLQIYPKFSQKASCLFVVPFEKFLVVLISWKDTRGLSSFLQSDAVRKSFSLNDHPFLTADASHIVIGISLEQNGTCD